MKYRVTLIDDASGRQQALVKLWSRNDLHKGRDPRGKYEWFYEGNPVGAAKAFFLVDADEAEPAPVGCCGLGKRTMWIDGQPRTAGLFADFAVDTAHRTVMPALMLQRALCTDARERFPLTYGFPNSAAVGIFQRIGFPLLGTIGRYVAILSYGPYVARVLRPRLAATAAGALLNLAAAARETLRGLARRRGTRLIPGTFGDRRIDALFEQARGRYRFIGERTSAFLEWRFGRRPGLTSELLTLGTSGGQLLAYAVLVQKEPGNALIADFFAGADEDLNDLFARLLPYLRGRGFASATTFFLGPAAVVRVLESNGFRPRDSSKFIVVGAGSGLHVPPEAVTVKEDWYLTEADRDN